MRIKPNKLFNYWARVRSPFQAVKIFLSLQKVRKVVGGVGALDILLLADDGLFVKAGLGSEHVLGLGVEGVNLSIEAPEKFDNSVVNSASFLAWTWQTNNFPQSAISTAEMASKRGSILKMLTSLVERLPRDNSANKRPSLARARAPREAMATPTWAPVST